MDIENELTKMLQEELSKALKKTPIGYDKINDAYHIGDGVFVNENQWTEYSTAKKTYPELTPKEFQLSELGKIYDKFKKEKNAPAQPAEFDASEKHAKDMDFREILNLLDEKEYQFYFAFTYFCDHLFAQYFFGKADSYYEVFYFFHPLSSLSMPSLLGAYSISWPVTLLVTLW